MGRLIKASKVVLAIGLIITFCALDVSVFAEEGSACAASHAAGKRTVEDVSEECETVMHENIELNFVMIACLGLFGGALGMVLFTSGENKDD